MSERREIYCCGCNSKVAARLTTGKEIYAHRPDLYPLPFWKCDGCGNYVGCHHKTKDRTRPLGVIATKELKSARQQIHKILDPLWQQNGRSRNKIYDKLSKQLGWTYHTAKIRDIEEARKIYRLVKAMY